MGSYLLFVALDERAECRVIVMTVYPNMNVGVIYLMLEALNRAEQRLGAAVTEDNDAEAFIRYALGFRDFIDAWNIGMYDIADVKRNIAIFADALK